jgi:cysteine-S-conjugate beta-lyase
MAGSATPTRSGFSASSGWRAAWPLGEDPAAVFLSRGRVALSLGPSFGSQGRGFARLNIGTSPQLIRDAVGRMAAAMT